MNDDLFPSLPTGVSREEEEESLTETTFHCILRLHSLSRTMSSKLSAFSFQLYKCSGLAEMVQEKASGLFGPPPPPPVYPGGY